MALRFDPNAGYLSTYKTPFNKFVENFHWKQGEHVSILGTTGSGKSYLSYHILPKRRFVVFCATKVQDETITNFGKKNGYELIRKWPPSPKVEKVLLWPRFSKPGDEANQVAIFYDALLNIFVEGAWCVYIDEAYYFSKILNFDPLLKIYWTQGRSAYLSLVAASQRPRDVPLLMYDQAVHLFFFRFRDKRDLDRLGELGWIDGQQIKHTVSRLEQFEFLYVNSQTGYMTISKVE